MGEKVQVGPLIYTVLDSEWKTEFGDGFDRQVAKDRFLIIHLTITNSGGGEAGAPLAQLVDARKKEHGELQDVKGLPQWMGLLRRLSPAATEDGHIVFDVPVGLYKLKVSASDLENEMVALVDIPLELNAAPAAPGGTIPQSK
jgi:Domain of unknown function (DUF4352)